MKQITISQLKKPGTKIPLKDIPKGVLYTTTKSKRIDNAQFRAFDCDAGCSNPTVFGITKALGQDCIQVESSAYAGSNYFEIPMTEFIALGIIKMHAKCKFSIEYLKTNKIAIECATQQEIDTVYEIFKYTNKPTPPVARFPIQLRFNDGDNANWNGRDSIYYAENGYVVISYDSFMMDNQKIIHFKLKDSYKKLEKAARLITEINSTQIYFVPRSIVHTLVEAAGVMHWFEPVFEPEPIVVGRYEIKCYEDTQTAVIGSLRLPCNFWKNCKCILGYGQEVYLKIPDTLDCVKLTQKVVEQILEKLED